MGLRPYSLLQEFQQARLRKDYQEALRLCFDAAKDQPELLPKLTDQPHFFLLDSVLASQTTIDKKGAEGLLAIHAYLAEKNAAESSFWHRQRSFSVIRFQSLIPHRLRPVLKTALSHHPEDLPFLVVEQFAEDLFTEEPSQKESWKPLMEEAIFLENILLHADVLYPEKALLCSQLGVKLFEWMGSICPKCEEIVDAYDTQLINNLVEPQEYRWIFSTLRFQQCPASAFSDTVLRRVNVFAPSPYYYRVAAGELVKKEEFVLAQRLLEASIEMDTIDRFKALDLLQLAQIYQFQQNFRTARLYAERANDLLPEWGRPWIFLADLIHQSAPFCNFSSLERKALNWLATDYCERGMNINPALKQDALMRINRYKNGYPSQEELLFFGFQLGDSFPIPCWIGTATRVRY